MKTLFFLLVVSTIGKKTKCSYFSSFQLQGPQFKVLGNCDFLKNFSVPISEPASPAAAGGHVSLHAEVRLVERVACREEQTLKEELCDEQRENIENCQ